MAPLIPVALFAAGATMTAVGAYQEKRSFDRQANAEEDAASAEADRISRSRKRQIGSARAKFGSAGVRIEGTPLDVLGDLAAEAELDRQLAIFGGDVKASAARQKGKAAIVKSVGSLLTQGASFGMSGGFDVLGGGAPATGASTGATSSSRIFNRPLTGAVDT